MLFGILAPFAALLMVARVDAAQCSGPADLQKAVTASPSADAYNALGAWFANRHQAGCAVAAFESALKLSSNSWQAHFNLGLALIESGNQDRASSEFRTVLQLNPSFTPARNAL